MKSLLPGLLLLFTACSRLPPEKTPREGRSVYSYTDVSGTYAFSRESKLVKRKLVTRAQLTDGKSLKVVEKSITVSQLGTIKDKKSRVLTLRPVASEFNVWLEGQRYSSRMQLSPKTKSMVVSVDGPDPKWKGTSEIPFPPGKYFCFYSQIPECLYRVQFLQRTYQDLDKGLEFYVLWDNYPFMQEQYSGLSRKLFSRARLKFEGEVKKIRRYVVELEGQIILYHFTDSYDLVKIAWIAQGITVVPVGEEIPNEEQ